MLSVIAGPDPRDRHSIPGGDVDWLAAARPTEHLGLRIGYCGDWGGLPLDPEVRAICATAAEKFATVLGCVVEEVPPPFGWEIEAFRTIVAMDTDIAGLRRLHDQQLLGHVGIPIGDPRLGKHPQAIALGVATEFLGRTKGHKASRQESAG